jgi:SAM-dependent methyltransferase
MNDRLHAESWAPDESGALYERGRPGYPATAGTVLAERLELGPASTVADVAAGTGKLTRLLAGLGVGRVLAVEPMPGMRRQLAATCPGAPLLGARAEQLPLRTGSLDAVTVAQAFHWLRLPDAAEELARVLRPGGRLAIVSNRPHHAAPWQEALWATLRRYEARNPRPASVRTWRQDLEATSCFGPFERVELDHEQRLGSLDDLDARMGSISHVLLLTPAERAAMLAEMHDIVGDTDPIVLGLRTVIDIAAVAGATARPA